jgi:hypothetical protein
METPVLFIFFNRADLAKKVFSTIRCARPKYLFLAADGPRETFPHEAETCMQTRANLEALIDWPCNVSYLYRNKNLGCQHAVSSAIDWFFANVEEGIILEDDTMPGKHFFRFAETLLERYRNTENVMHISGNNFQFGRVRGDGAYYASRFAHSWGWATWRRAWKRYEIDIPDFPQKWKQVAAECNLSSDIANWWEHNLQATKSGRSNTWDFQWHYAIMKYTGISLIPNVNLVKNIGVGVNATHMQGRHIASSIGCRPLNSFSVPSQLDVCYEADQFDFQFILKNKKPDLMSINQTFQFIKFLYEFRK